MDIQRFKPILEKLLRELSEIEDTGKQAAETVELDQAKVGRLSRMDAMQAQAMSEESNRRREEKIKAIHAALQRIEDDDYGYCEECGDEINEKRLEFDPTALYCVECAGEFEKR